MKIIIFLHPSVSHRGGRGAQQVEALIVMGASCGYVPSGQQQQQQQWRRQQRQQQQQREQQQKPSSQGGG